MDLAKYIPWIPGLAAVLCGLVAFEAIHFREARERLRQRLLHSEAAA